VAHVPFEELKVGTFAQMEWTVAAGDLDAFAAVSGDINPLHVDAEFARQRGFPDRVAHGFLLGAKVSAFVGTVMPGRDCLLLETQLAWPNPCFAGDVVRLRGEIVELSPENRVMRIKFRAVATRAGSSVVVGRGWTLCQTRS
jgi:3-hydroxybutyryl-CoA dehydratase